MTTKQWREFKMTLPPKTRDKGYWKGVAWWTGRNGGCNCPLATDFMNAHPEKYFHYEAERQLEQ